MSKFLKVFPITFLVIIGLSLTACSQSVTAPQQPPESVEGVIDLRDWDISTDESINLSGEWGFFWEELLQPDQIKSSTPVVYVPVPEIWPNYDIDGITFTPEGYATFTLSLYLPDPKQVYGLYIEGQGTTYSLWVDGQLLAQNGQVGSTSQAMMPEKKPATVFFEPEGELVEMVMQISNFHHRKAGFRNSLLLGAAETIHRYQLQNWFIEAFSVGTLFVMGLYHFFIFIFRRKNLAPLYFALLSWAMTIRIGVTNQSTLLFHVPIINWSLALRLEYLVFFMAPLLFILYIQSLYPQDIHRWFIRVVFVLSIGFTLMMIFSDTLTLSYTSTYYQVIYILNIIYFLYILGRIIVRRREGAFYIGFASFIVFAGVIIETLILQNIIKAIYIKSFLPIDQITSFSFLAFIFVQAILLASRSSRSFDQVESLSSELVDVNVNLQQSERKYRSIFEDSKDMIFIVGLDAQVEDVSPACQEVLGYTKPELLKIKLLDLIVDPEDNIWFQDAISDQRSIQNYEVELKRKDGLVIQTLVSATPRLNQDGKITGVRGSVRDITSRKEAEAERMRALELEQIAIKDPLTKIYNRRFFIEVAEKELERDKRKGSPLSVIILDIDHYKKVNDSYGHLIGDQVLINLANLCLNNIRNMDIFARFGGDEFVILMPDTDKKMASETADRLRVLVAEKPMAASDKSEVPITISLGISDWNSEIPIEINELLDQADQALYQAKQAGRNRVKVWRITDSP